MPRKAWHDENTAASNPYIIEQCVRNYESSPLPPKKSALNGSNNINSSSSNNNHNLNNGNVNGGSGGGGGTVAGQSLHFNSMETGHLVLNEEGLVNVHLVADEQGRFGFNVKGGADLKLPVLVSRVAPHTPAEQSKISEGDQVVLINGRDISGLKHEQVVSLIRTSRESRGGELVLTIKPQGEY